MDGWTLGLVALGLLLVVAKWRAGHRSARQLEEIALALRDGASLIDVRTPAEFGAGHLPGARNLPVHTLGAGGGGPGPKGRPVVLYCASGSRSASAARQLRAAGYQRVLDLGPMGNWARLPSPTNPAE